MASRNPKLEITSTIPILGDKEESSDICRKELIGNETAIKMLLNKAHETDKLYSIKTREAERKNKEIRDLYHKINMLEKKSSERLSAVLITTIAEIVTAIGVGILSPSENKIIPALVIFAGMLMTGISLWLNFKSASTDKKDDLNN